MRKHKVMRPEEIVDLSIDYYGVLGLKKGEIPDGKNREEKMALSMILQVSRRKMVRYAHPDFGGSDEAFSLLLQAEYILEDPVLRRYYDSGGSWRPSLSGVGSDFEVDWDSLGTYRKNTQADIVGHTLFALLSGQTGKRAKDLGLIPAFHPTEASQNYEWDWVILVDENDRQNIPELDDEKKKSSPKIALSLVYDDQEIKRLTSGEAALSEDFVPFKIYACIPRGVLHYLRDEKERYELENGEVDEFNGKLQAAIYSDYELLETTSLAEARAYFTIGGAVEKDLEDFRNGTLSQKQAKLDKVARRTQFIDSKELMERDREVLKAVMRSKSFRLVRDPRAADFLDQAPDK